MGMHNLSSYYLHGRLTRRWQIEQVTTDIPFIAVGITAFAAVTCLLLTQRLSLCVSDSDWWLRWLMYPQSRFLYPGLRLLGIQWSHLVRLPYHLSRRLTSIQ